MSKVVGTSGNPRVNPRAKAPAQLLAINGLRGLATLCGADGAFRSVSSLLRVGIASCAMFFPAVVGAAAPEITGSVADVVAQEDADPILVDFSGVFSDADLPNDTLTLSVNADSGETLFNSIAVSGLGITLTLNPDSNGTAVLAVTATDSEGNATPQPYLLTVTVNPLADDVQAVADNFATTEDSAAISLDVLANDLGDPPLELVSVTQPEDFFLDGQGSVPQANPQGLVTITDDRAVFTPGANFAGEASFTYVVRDADGQTDTGLVVVSVTSVNDAPAALDRDYTVAENSELEVTSANGLLLGAFDLDAAVTDQAGNPLVPPATLSVVINSLPDPALGTLVSTTNDGAFIFRPAQGVINTTVVFTYRVFDNNALSDPAEVRIFVQGNPDVPEAPNPGEVSVLFDLANAPLEQTASVDANVLINMDDSISMHWNLIIEGTDIFQLSNAGIAQQDRRAINYHYLFPLPTNQYVDRFFVVPAEDALPVGSDYETWRVRYSGFNPVYYNPAVRYVPWVGVDAAGQVFTDAQPAAARLDPLNTAQLYNLLTEKTFTSPIPAWSNFGGEATVTTTNHYIPQYYTEAGVLIEIRPGSTYPGGPQRTDCANPAVCSFDEEIVNFANWFQYYRSRDYIAKAATGAVIADLGDVRVGFETINRQQSEPIAPMNQYFYEGEKKELLDKVYLVQPSDSTPLRRALDDAGRILSCDFPGRPCPALPAPEGSCQQNFTLLFTDGVWNNAEATVTANYDADGPGIFDGGRYADNQANTLADVAMFYYENDIQPGLPDQVPPLTIDFDSLPDGLLAEDALLHQHMKTYVISFGVSGGQDPDDLLAVDPSDPIAWPDPQSSVDARIDDVIHATMNGRGRFLNAGSPQELQAAVEAAFLEFNQSASSSSAAAFNSSSLREGTLLYRGFYDLRTRTGELTATEVDNAGVIAQSPTWEAAEQLDTLPFASRPIATWNDDTKDGVVLAFNNLSPDQQTLFDADQINFLRGDRNNEMPGGVLRQRQANAGLLGDIVNSSPIFVGAPRAINRDQAPYPTSDLYSAFASSQAGREEMVYVGANDGMLHGFSAATGAERMAFMPNALLDASIRGTNKLDQFTSPFYLHEYFVDGTPALNDVYMARSVGGTKAWRTVMVGGLGGGGKGYYALDVTSPATQFNSAAQVAQSVVWEFTESDDTYPETPNGAPLGGAVGALTDPDGLPVRDLGVALSAPVVSMSNVSSGGQQDWVAIFGNGPNSTAGVATLFVLFLEKGQDGWQPGDFEKISTGFGVPLPGEPLAGFPNGLGTPTALDADLNGTTDYVYAGDRLGNLYRFDLTDPNPSNWRAVRLFTAYHEVNGGNRTVQPVLSKPLVSKHPQKPGFLITFGTGSFVANEDAANTDIQSVYTIWDDLTPNNPITAQPNTRETRLVEQFMTNEVEEQDGVLRTRRVVTNTDVTYTAGLNGTYGWYIDLEPQRAALTQAGNTNPDQSGNAPPGAQFPGERAIRRFINRNGTLVTTTVLPSSNAFACFGARPGAVLVINLLTGGDAVEPVIDFNRDGVIDQGDLVGGVAGGASGGVLYGGTGTAFSVGGQLVDLSVLSGAGGEDFLFVSGGSDTEAFRIRSTLDNKTGRLSWTELR